jgi:Uma2 family endonuclease
MATATEPPLVRADQQFLLRGVSWKLYQTMLDELGERPGLRLTYDRGDLEFMSTSQLHEFLKSMLARLIWMLSWELQIPIRTGGSFTFKREDLERGFEPDECYWVQNEPAVRGKQKLDFTIDPPPDLAVEIDVARTWLDRKSIYAAFRVPELWCHDGKSIKVYRLNAEGDYELSDASAAFPFLPVHELVRFLEFDEQVDELTRLREFVEWLRELDIPEQRDDANRE